VIPHAFGERPPFTLGVEEEFFVLDGDRLDPVPVPEALLDGERFKPELFRALLELNTEVCTTPAEAGEQLAALRAQAVERAAAEGLALGATGTWPIAYTDVQEVTPEPGFLAFAEYAGSSAQRQFCCGLHVHVGVESPEACLDALEFVLPWLPALLAVSANSPWFEGRETGLASTRAELLGLLPRTGAPPVFAAYADWERFAERLVRLGLADSYRRLWWDVRPHPGYGTLEVRVPDQPTRLEVSVALVGFVQALVRAAEPGPPADRGVYAQNRWAARRFGPQALLIHPERDELLPARELLAELGERIGADLGPLAEIDQAEEQLRSGREEGLDALCRGLLAG
jgi:glutamate---cysteine ligase / carboxylate-amine ligase